MGMTVFAGLSFSGANLLFKYWDPSDYGREAHRHNLKMEEFAKAHEMCNRENIENEQRIRHLQMEKHDANGNFNITNKNLAYLKKNQEHIKKKEPKKSDYYQPSQKMQKYEKVSSGMIGFGLAYGGTKLLDFLLWDLFFLNKLC